jgi:hypothetical protein
MCVCEFEHCLRSATNTLFALFCFSLLYITESRSLREGVDNRILIPMTNNNVIQVVMGDTTGMTDEEMRHQFFQQINMAFAAAAAAAGAQGAPVNDVADSNDGSSNGGSSNYDGSSNEGSADSDEGEEYPSEAQD